MKRRISSHIRWSRYLFLVLGIGLFTVLIMYASKDTIDRENMIIIGIFLMICLVLYYVFDQAKTVEFDNEFMYVTRKSVEEKIPLKNIFKIKLTMMEINDKSLWKIGYYDNRRVEKSVRILPGFLNKHFDEFKTNVRLANKNVKIKNWSHSFDFDQ